MPEPEAAANRSSSIPLDILGFRHSPEHPCCFVKGFSGSGGVFGRPGGAPAGHGVDLQRQLPHHRHRRRFPGFAPLTQASMEIPQLSPAQGAKPISASRSFPPPRPGSGSSPARVAAVNGPMPDTLQYSSACRDRASLPESRA